ncbi:MAG: hypothetical protein LLG06_20345 [Desulfobacteraceae bacterium]|nr:hypothetical protein [Desulfobacteraceae bacterium]
MPWNVGFKLQAHVFPHLPVFDLLPEYHTASADLKEKTQGPRTDFSQTGAVPEIPAFCEAPVLFSALLKREKMGVRFTFAGFFPLLCRMLTQGEPALPETMARAEVLLRLWGANLTECGAKAT